MKKLNFDWDPNKNKEKIKKHKISFDEAKDVFYDDNAILFDDPEHSDKEERFLIIGRIRNLNIYVVSHYYKEKKWSNKAYISKKSYKKRKRNI